MPLLQLTHPRYEGVQLRVQFPQRHGRALRTAASAVVIGKAPDADVVIRSADIADLHAALVPLGNHVYLEALAPGVFAPGVFSTDVSTADGFPPRGWDGDRELDTYASVRIDGQAFRLRDFTIQIADRYPRERVSDSASDARSSGSISPLPRLPAETGHAMRVLHPRGGMGRRHVLEIWLDDTFASVLEKEARDLGLPPDLVLSEALARESCRLRSAARWRVRTHPGDHHYAIFAAPWVAADVKEGCASASQTLAELVRNRVCTRLNRRRARGRPAAR